MGRNLESCVFSWSNSSSISSLWLELATGSVSERVLTICWFPGVGSSSRVLVPRTPFSFMQGLPGIQERLRSFGGPSAFLQGSLAEHSSCLSS